jgi:ubiquitin C-terminal hydrolase
MEPYLFSPNKNNNKPINYNLFAAILHRGSLNGGHYTCIRRNNSKNLWLYCDDEKLHQIK